jgi:tRNA1(Val) A37 N6-methylase TrmN6
VTGIECNPKAAEIADLAAKKNDLEDRLVTVAGDLRNCREYFQSGAFDLCVANPPYFPIDSGAAASGENRRRARSEEGCTIEDVCRAAGYLLRWGGDFSVVFPAGRVCDLFCALRQFGMEPKILRPVETKPETPTTLLLVQARRGGKPGLIWESTLKLAETKEGES